MAPARWCRWCVAALVVGTSWALPTSAGADEEPPDPGKPFDQPVTPLPDVRLAQNRGLWLQASGGFFAALGGGRGPRAGGAVAGGWGLGNGLVLEGQVGAWYYTRPISTDDEYAGAVAVPILAGARYRFVTLWRHRPVPYAAAHLGPVVTRAAYPGGASATKGGFGLQAAVGVQIPFHPQWLVDCAFGYLLDAAGAPAAGTVMERFGTGHALFLTVGVAFHPPRREVYDPLGLRQVRPPAPQP
jgi:hypothetical protein